MMLTGLMIIIGLMNMDGISIIKGMHGHIMIQLIEKESLNLKNLG